MSKHTQGPWTQDKYGNVTDASGQTIRVEGVALTGRSTEESRANARLIASAPDLLKALECLIECAEYGPVSDSADAWIDARAAIAKATDV